ncbi:MAG: L-threonylcarbamoyladenylate synthase [Candidatus Staskawiczbacteria bacterium]|nr:L-threonylcarbamoyladenylate synthase [Candidatus Staskawiczbacteria bacterium]
MEIVKKSKIAKNKAIKVLLAGGVVICPTDTVYGFLADATNKKAVEKIYKMKKRPRSKPLAVFVKDFKMARSLAEINENQERIVKKYWPGKFTFIFKRKKRIKIYDGAKNTIALRIPSYKFLNDLLKKINKPLVQTSVNISGQPLLSKINNMKNQLGNKNILLIDGGDLPKSKASTIIDLSKSKIEMLRK